MSVLSTPTGGLWARGVVNPTAGGTANTKGAWSDLINPLPFDAWAVQIDLVYIGASGAPRYLCDIGILDGGGSVLAIPLPNLHYCQTGALRARSHLHLPLRIPAGARIATRIQSDTASSVNLSVGVLCYAASWFAMPMAYAVAHGANTGTSGGTTIDPGATVDTFGSWVTLTSSTPVDYRGLFAALGNNANTAMTDARWVVQIGVRPSAGNEYPVWQFTLNASTTSDCITPTFDGPYPVTIPAGSWIGCRAYCNITDATDRLFQIVVYGMV